MLNPKLDHQIQSGILPGAILPVQCCMKLLACSCPETYIYRKPCPPTS